MGEKWDDARDGHIADCVHGVCREMAAFQQDVDEILAPSPTPAQRKELVRQAEADAAKLDGVGLVQLEGTVKEQANIIDKLAHRVAMLHNLIEQRRAADAGVGVCTIGPDTQAALDLHDDLFDEQNAIIVGQRAAIEALREWSQERDDGISNLGMRTARLETQRDRQPSINQDIYRQMRGWRDGLDKARKAGDDALDQRIQARAVELAHRIERLEELIENHKEGDGE